jgi:hypothetical protein
LRLAMGNLSWCAKCQPLPLTDSTAGYCWQDQPAPHPQTRYLAA